MPNNTTKPKVLSWNVLNHINCICNAIENCSLEPVRDTLYQTTILRLNEYFGTTEVQTWILCFAIWQHFNDNSYIMPRELACYLDTNVLKVAAMNSDFIELRKRNLIEYSDSKSTFTITPEVIKAVVSNETLPFLADNEITYLDFIHKMAAKYENRKYVDDTCDDLVSQLNNIEDYNNHLPLVIRSKELFPDDKTRYMFYDLCNDCLLGMASYLMSTIDDIYDSNERAIVGHQFLDERHPFFETGMVQFVEKGNMLESRITLSEKGKKFFLDTDYSLYEEKVDDSILKKPAQIRTKKLFYSSEIQKQIDDLADTLMQSKYTQIQKRLAKKGLPGGIAVMLYGAAGCGKTETVLQLAKKTGRAIMQVDISNTKSCWFGESEKIIKQVFTDYKRACEIAENKKGARKPILLFNECDAVFSKRKDVNSSNIAQVENSIQNIILEEMEHLNGILIATTNLVDNLDPAFERRFLFKIRFENPSVEAKLAIWQNKIRWLSRNQAQNLAENFSFSGGEIENIVRKAEMKEIISGKRPDFAEIVEMCKVEKLCTGTPQPRRMGFTVI